MSARRVLAAVLLLALCLAAPVQSDSCTFLEIPKELQTELTAAQRDASPDHLVPFCFATAGASPVKNGTIKIEFCSQCGRVSIYARASSAPTPTAFDWTWKSDSTGNATSPEYALLSPLSVEDAIGNRLFLGIDFEEPNCALRIETFTDSYLTRPKVESGTYHLDYSVLVIFFSFSSKICHFRGQIASS